jgi:asparagine synthase (glutamine-hydrolysing)
LCGIAGFFDRNGTRTPVESRQEELIRMLQYIAHRGPDQSGYILDSFVALGAVRLAIQDAENGLQPFSDTKQRYWLVFNGEIHNFVEIRSKLAEHGVFCKTECDTEVVLNAWIKWGADALVLFDGGFAFALYDRKETKLTLVRDRFGERPLFYRICGSAFYFASEIKSFLGKTSNFLRWDKRNLASIFYKWAPSLEETPFENVYQVVAGTVLEIDSSGIRKTIFANAIDDEDLCYDSFELACEKIRELLSNSTSMRLRSSKKPALLLSGGLDSTVLAYILREKCPERLDSFSIVFKDPRFDESRFQEVASEYYQTNHTSLQVSHADIGSVFPTALWHAEIPQFRSSIAPMFLIASAIKKAGHSSAISGEGADEFFLGYDLFKETDLRSRWSQIAPHDHVRLIRKLYHYLPHFTEENARRLLPIFGSRGSFDSPLFTHELRLRNSHLAVELLEHQPTADESLDPLRKAMMQHPVFSMQRKAQWIEIHTLLQGFLLSSQSDRMLFGHGIEPRCPFLSHGLTRYSSTLPTDFLLDFDWTEKKLLKAAFRGNIPQQVIERKKQPYVTPDAASFFDIGGEALPWVRQALSDAELEIIEPLNKARARQFVALCLEKPLHTFSPRMNQAFLLLLSLSVLNRQFVYRGGADLRLPLPPLRKTVILPS